MKPKPTELLRNLSRDLRDRRLISISIALIVAIVAIPLLLGGGDSTVAPTATSSGAAGVAPLDGVEQIDPVVLADVPGLRDFHERLDQYRSRNPFKQQLTGPVSGGGTGAASGATGGGGAGTIPVEGSAPPPTTTSTGATTPPDPGPPTTPEPTTPDTTTPSTDPPPPPPDPQPGQGEEPATRIVTFTLDVRVGPLGDTRVLHGVKPLDVLPDRQHAIAQYVSGDADGATAAFVLSDDVVTATGDGHCAPSRERCRFLSMKVGDDETFAYGPDGLAYRLQLLDIDMHTEAADPAGHGRGTTAAFAEAHGN